MPVESTTLPGINPGLNIGPRVTNRDLGDPGGTVVLTVGQILGGMVSLTPTTTTTLQLPTAAEFVEDYLTSNVIPSDSIPLLIRNFGAAGVDLSIVLPAGNTISGSGVVAGGNFRQYCARINTVGAAAAYTLFDKGSAGSAATLQGPSPVIDNAVLVYDGTSGDSVKETLAGDPLIARTNTDSVYLGTGGAAAIATGSSNTVLGDGAASALSTASNTVAIGQGAGVNGDTGSSNVAIGQQSGWISSTSANATSIGTASRAGAGGVAIGQNAVAGTDSTQVVIGQNTNGGAGCITIGANAGSDGATDSIAIGASALDDATAGKVQNIAIGNGTLGALTTGDNNVHIGFNAGLTATTASNTVLIGNAAVLAAVGSVSAIGIGAGVTGTSAPDTDEIYIDSDPAHLNTQSLFVPRLAAGTGASLSVTAAGQIVSDEPDKGISAALVAGTLTVTSTTALSTSVILLTHNTQAGTAGILSAPAASIVDNTSFDIVSSSGTDTGTVNFVVLN